MAEKQGFFGSPVASIPFEILEMLQQANDETLPLLEIFQYLKKYEVAETPLSPAVILVINNYLYVKKFQEDKFDIFLNNFFINLNQEKQYILFLKIEYNREVLQSGIIKILESLGRHFQIISASKIINRKNVLIEKVIQTELGSS
jgi:hypothetical protein